MLLAELLHRDVSADARAWLVLPDAAVVALWAMCAVKPVFSTVKAYDYSRRSYEVLLVSGFAPLLGLVLFGTSTKHRGVIARLANAKALRALGASTFQVYLFQDPMHRLFSVMIYGANVNTEFSRDAFICYVVTLWASAVAFNEFVETPVYNVLARVIDKYVAPPKTARPELPTAQAAEPLLADARKDAAEAVFKQAAEADGRSGGIWQLSILTAGVVGLVFAQCVVVGMVVDGEPELRCGLAVADPDSGTAYPTFNQCGGAAWTGPTCCYSSLAGQQAASASCAPWDAARSYCIYASPEGLGCGGPAWTGPSICAPGLVCEPKLLTCVCLSKR